MVTPNRDDRHHPALVVVATARRRWCWRTMTSFSARVWAGLLESSGFEIVGQTGNGRELIELVRELGPELVIVYIRMPPTHTTEGLDAASSIREEFPDTAIVVLSAHVQVERATELLSGGHRVGY